MDAKESAYKIHYDGEELYVAPRANPTGFIASVADAAKTGGVVWVNHQGGRSLLTLGPGIPLRVDLLEDIPAIGIH